MLRIGRLFAILIFWDVIYDIDVLLNTATSKWLFYAWPFLFFVEEMLLSFVHLFPSLLEIFIIWILALIQYRRCRTCITTHHHGGQERILQPSTRLLAKISSVFTLDFGPGTPFRKVCLCVQESGHLRVRGHKFWFRAV